MYPLSARALTGLVAGALVAVSTAGSASAASAPVASVQFASAPAASAQFAAPHAATSAAAALPSFSTWVADVTTVTDQASAYLATRLPATTIKPAIVLDIDNTSLATEYQGGLTIPAIAPVLALAKQAKAAGAAVIFVTARPEILTLVTEHNLTKVGYPRDGLYMRGTFNFSSAQTLKTNARIAIEKAGYTIVANIGNNTSDLDGGHAERTFKLPDYDGQLD